MCRYSHSFLTESDSESRDLERKLAAPHWQIRTVYRDIPPFLGTYVHGDGKE